MFVCSWKNVESNEFTSNRLERISEIFGIGIQKYSRWMSNIKEKVGFLFIINVEEQLIKYIFEMQAVFYTLTKFAFWTIWSWLLELF